VEIRSEIAAGATVTFDAQAAAKIVTWGTNQWVSYDDAQTLKLK
jgi:chitinase